MAWDLIALGTMTDATSGNLTLNEPTGTAQGDLIVACIAYRSNAAFTLPSGGEWSLVATQQSSGNTDATQGIASGLMAYCVRGASAPNYVFTRTAGDIARGRTITYRGGTSTPYNTGGATTLGTIGEPALTGFTAAANDLLVAMISHGDNSLTATMDAATDPGTASNGTDTTTDPTVGTWIERQDDGTNTGADVGLFIADAVKTGAGSTGNFSADAATTTRSVFIVGAFTMASIVDKSLADSGSGAEAQTIQGATALVESGSGAEAQIIAAALALAETGAGDDVLSVVQEVLKSLADSGAGSDAIAELVSSLAASDSGAGTDLISVLEAALALAETGAGADVVYALEAALALAESGAGEDLLAVVQTVEKILADTGSGEDLMDVDYGAIDKQIADSGSGVDILILAIDALLADAGSGVDAQTIYAEIFL